LIICAFGGRGEGREERRGVVGIKMALKDEFR